MSGIDPVSLLPPLLKSYTREEALAELDELYGQLPDVRCKRLCHDSCTVIPASELEYQRIAEAGGSIGPRLTGQRVLELLVTGDDSYRCPALSPRKACSIYPTRPFICRVFGVAAGMRCEHGCVPDKVMPNGEVSRLMARIEQLSRHVTGVRAWRP